MSPSNFSENNHISHSSSQENSSLPVIQKVPYNQKIEQGIIQKVILFIQKETLASSINTSKFNIVVADEEGRDLAQLFFDAEDAEDKMIKAKQKENVRWYAYRESYENKVAEICSKTSVAEKIAKSQVYIMIKASLPKVSDSNLYKKTGVFISCLEKLLIPQLRKKSRE